MRVLLHSFAGLSYYLFRRQRKPYPWPQGIAHQWPSRCSICWPGRWRSLNVSIRG